MGSTATPRLKTGALQHAPRRLFGSGIPAALRIGGLIANPLVTADDSTPVRLDTVLAGRTAVLTARRPDAALADYCRRHGLVLLRINSEADRPAADPDAGWIDIRPVGDERAADLPALAVLGSNRALTVTVRPDRVIAAAEPRGPASPAALAHPGHRPARARSRNSTRWCWAAGLHGPVAETRAPAGRTLGRRVGRPAGLAVFQRRGRRTSQAADNPVDVTKILQATRARDHEIFTGKLARKHLSFPDRAMVSAIRAQEGNFRNWAQIRTWAAGVADTLLT
jgi:hypothetical protein